MPGHHNPKHKQLLVFNYHFHSWLTYHFQRWCSDCYSSYFQTSLA